MLLQMALFPFLWLNNISVYVCVCVCVCINMSHLLNPFVKEHLGCFQVLAIVITATLG